MKFISNRRFRVEKLERILAELVATTAHDIITPLTGMELTISLLHEDDEVKQLLGDERMEILSSAASCSDIVARICRTSFDRLQSAKTNENSCVDNKAWDSLPCTRIDDLVKSLQIVTDAMKSKIPISISVDKNVPRVVALEEVNLLRSALNLVEHSVLHSSSGTIQLSISIQTNADCRWNATNSQSSMLMFECKHVGGFTSTGTSYFQIFSSKSNGSGRHLPLGLQSVALLIDSMNGSYGFRSLSMEETIEGIINGNVLWFGVPLASISIQNASTRQCDIDSSVSVNSHSGANLSNESKLSELDDGGNTREVEVDSTRLGFVDTNVFSKIALKKVECSSSIGEDLKTSLLLKCKQHASAPVLEEYMTLENVRSLHNFDWSMKPKNKNCKSILSLKRVTRIGLHTNVVSNTALKKVECSSSIGEDFKRSLLLKCKQHASAPVLKRSMNSNNFISLHNFDWSMKPKNNNYESNCNLKRITSNDYLPNERIQSKRLRFS